MSREKISPQRKLRNAIERMESASTDLLKAAERFTDDAPPLDRAWHRKWLFEAARKYTSAVNAVTRARK